MSHVSLGHMPLSLSLDSRPWPLGTGQSSYPGLCLLNWHKAVSHQCVNGISGSPLGTLQPEGGLLIKTLISASFQALHRHKGSGCSCHLVLPGLISIKPQTPDNVCGCECGGVTVLSLFCDRGRSWGYAGMSEVGRVPSSRLS